MKNRCFFVWNIQSPFDSKNNRHNKDSYSNYLKNVTPTKNIQGLVLSKRDRNRLHKSKVWLKKVSFFSNKSLSQSISVSLTCLSWIVFVFTIIFVVSLLVTSKSCPPYVMP